MQHCASVLLFQYFYIRAVGEKKHQQRRKLIMRPILKYFSEDGEAPVIDFTWGTVQPFMTSFSRGVKWESPQKNEVTFFQKNVTIRACPCIHHPYFILVFTGFNSYEHEKNFAVVVDYEGTLVKRLELQPAISELSLNHKNEIKVSRFSNASWEAINGQTVVCVTIDMVVHIGWLNIWEKRIFDEENLALDCLVDAWKEP